MVKLIRRYFIFDAIVNGIVFLISLSDSFLLVYRNVTGIGTLILHPKNLLNSFIALIHFWQSLWGFLYTILCHLQTLKVKHLAFQFGCFLLPFLEYSLARTSNTMLNRRGNWASFSGS